MDPTSHRRCVMWLFDNQTVPDIRTKLPGPKAQALEAALKLARWHTGRSRAVAFFGAFHGRTYGAMSLSGSKLVHRRGFSPLVPDIHHVSYPRGCQACNDRDAGCACVAQIEETIFKPIAPP